MIDLVESGQPLLAVLPRLCEVPHQPVRPAEPGERVPLPAEVTGLQEDLTALGVEPGRLFVITHLVGCDPELAEQVRPPRLMIDRLGPRQAVPPDRLGGLGVALFDDHPSVPGAVGDLQEIIVAEPNVPRPLERSPRRIQLTGLVEGHAQCSEGAGEARTTALLPCRQNSHHLGLDAVEVAELAQVAHRQGLRPQIPVVVERRLLAPGVLDRPRNGLEMVDGLAPAGEEVEVLQGSNDGHGLLHRPVLHRPHRRRAEVAELGHQLVLHPDLVGAADEIIRPFEEAAHVVLGVAGSQLIAAIAESTGAQLPEQWMDVVGVELGPPHQRLVHETQQHR